MAERLPTEMIVAVLCRVPVKDLLRCRAVCKRWRSLLDGPDFIKMHLDHQCRCTAGKTPNAFLLTEWQRIGLYWVDLHELESGVDLIIGDNNMVGSCHGLVAIAGLDGEFSLLNPSIRRFWMLPTDHDYYPEMTQVVVYGFGYDVVNDDDFKLVTVAQPHPYLEPEANFETELKVYSAKIDSWKRTTIGHGYGYGSSFHLLYEGFKTGNGFPLANALQGGVAKTQPRNSQIQRLGDRVVRPRNRRVPRDGWAGLRRPYPPQDEQARHPRRRSQRVRLPGFQRSLLPLRDMVDERIRGQAVPSGRWFSFVDTHRELDMMSGCVLNCEMDGRVALYDVERKRVENMWIVGSSLQLQAQACIESLVGLVGCGWRQAEEYSPRRAEELGFCPLLASTRTLCSWLIGTLIPRIEDFSTPSGAGTGTHRSYAIYIYIYIYIFFW